MTQRNPALTTMMNAPKIAPVVAARPWLFTFVVAGMALALRLFLIRYLLVDSGDDLRIYTYFGDLMAHGANPYAPPLDAPISAHYANIAPFNLAFFAAILALRDSPETLRIAFAVVDALIILTVGLLVRRPLAWRQAVMIFYAFNPLVLVTLVVNAQDKVVVLWLLMLLLVAVEANRAFAAIALTTILTLYRWLGAFFILPLSLFFARNWRSLLLMLGGFGVVLLLSHVPYWPDNLAVYTSRSARTLIDPPIHSSPTLLLSVLGLYSPLFVSIAILASTAVLYALFAFDRIGIVELIVLVTFFTNIFAPELPVSRILMVGLPLLWLIVLSRSRVWTLWILTTVAALVVLPEPAQTLLALDGAGWQALYGWLISPVPNMAIMNLPTLFMLIWYLIDKRAGRVSSLTLSAEAHTRDTIRA